MLNYAVKNIILQLIQLEFASHITVYNNIALDKLFHLDVLFSFWITLTVRITSKSRFQFQKQTIEIK